MKYGAAWYPEHWRRQSWANDLRLMREADMNVVRVAEFAWSRLEPSEGRCDFDWLEDAITLAAQHGTITIVINLINHTAEPVCFPLGSQTLHLSAGDVQILKS
jgi:beta-galactosidase GanA